ncbi:MAG: tRNA lysidine(34) synthetase TilS, partial [Candidatus Omnitrophota bacterium]
MLESGDSLLVGVSGGPDSVCLVHLLNSLKKELNLKIFVAHLDHCLRKDSHKDLLFVKNLSSRLNLNFISESINVGNFTKDNSLEEAARKIRFDFFFRRAKKLKIKKIVLGHNLDDQAETVLMRLIRGAGLLGLSAIAPVKKINNFFILRPLLSIKRKDIEKYLKKNKIKYHLDYTNKDILFFRNKIRQELLPLLEKKYNTKIKEILANTRDNIALDYEYLSLLTQDAFKKCIKYNRKHEIKIDLSKFLRLHPSLQRMVLRRCLQQLCGNTRRFDAQHIKELNSLIYERPYNSFVDLPQNISVIK